MFIYAIVNTISVRLAPSIRTNVRYICHAKPRTFLGCFFFLDFAHPVTVDARDKFEENVHLVASVYLSVGRCVGPTFHSVSKCPLKREHHTKASPEQKHIQM